ncbi:hypothetical protein PR202_gb05339 [Eleusine coracana subsp. coracana]|uniref:VQ domain-containing protein n=1 Tax=Eleusine coracana subsp. coracana TaxID=191504 RepID=A0AAV5E6E3_ELECO|nr:hypothetical protein PR202_gb05339 [Eleusine coracana subsp. coracana]
MSTREGEARPATVKIIETVHVDADRFSFKSVVQRFTGRDAVVGDWSEGSERASTDEPARRAEYVSKQERKPSSDRK